MSFVPTGILDDIKKLANIEKDGEVIAFASNSNTKKKKDQNNDKKKKNSKKEMNKEEQRGSQFPLLNEKSTSKRYKSNNMDESLLNSETISTNNNLSKSSTPSKKNLIKNNKRFNNSSNSLNNKNVTHSNEDLKNNYNASNNSSMLIDKAKLKISSNEESRINSSEKTTIGNIKMKQTITPIEPPAFQYPITKKRVGHLQNKSDKTNKLKKELAFLYDISNNTKENNSNDLIENINNEINKESHIDTIVNEIIPKINTTPNNNNNNTLFNESKKLLNGNENQNFSKDEVSLLAKTVIPKDLNPKELNFVTLKNDKNDKEIKNLHPSLTPVSRKEVILLKYEMIKSLEKKGLIDSKGNDINYPTDMHSFLKIIKEEQQLYDIVFKELIRQVTIQMNERGELLSYLRKRYSNMFSKIPEHILNIHTELIAQRKISERLATELVRSKKVILKLIKEIDEIKIHDQEISKQAEKAQNKLLNILTESDGNDLVLEEYQKLYRMQRNRLEENNKLTENEKRTWTNLAITLALRIGKEHGFTEIIQLQSYCNTRLFSSIQIISFTNEEKVKFLNELDKKIDVWTHELIDLSHSIIEEDENNIEVLTKLAHEITLVQNNFEFINDTDNETEFSKNVNMFDISVLIKSLNDWINMTTQVSTRFTSEKDTIVIEKIKLSKTNSQEWCEYAYNYLKILKKSPNGKRFDIITDKLNIIIKLIEEWYLKLEIRVTGEDGVASQVISLQNQVEDRYNIMKSKGSISKLSNQDKNVLNGYLNQWQTEINSILSNLRVSSKSDMTKVPKNITTWISNIRELLNSDYEFQKEENEKLNQKMLSWMANVLAQISVDTSSPLDNNEKELVQLLQEINHFNTTLKDCENYIDKKENNEKIKKLTDIIKNITENWENTARKLIKHEKEEQERLNDTKKNGNLNIEELISKPEESMNLINSINEFTKVENQSLSTTNE